MVTTQIDLLKIEQNVDAPDLCNEILTSHLLHTQKMAMPPPHYSPLSDGDIIGITISAVVFVAILIALARWWVHRTGKDEARKMATGP